MTRILAALLVLTSVVQAAPAAKKDPPPWLVAKNNKKQLEIEKHEMLAEYYLLRANDPASARLARRFSGSSCRIAWYSFVALAGSFARNR